MPFSWGTKTGEFNTLSDEAHLRSTPAMGAPTLVWHVATWPAVAADPQAVKVRAADTDTSTPLKARHDAVAEFNRKRREFLLNCNNFLIHLQNIGRASALREEFKFEQDSPQSDAVLRVSDQSVTFTLWWPVSTPNSTLGGQPPEPLAADGGMPQKSAPIQRIPPQDAILIRVRADFHTGFVTFSFFIDLSDTAHFRLSASAIDESAANLAQNNGTLAEGRGRLMEAINNVKRICDRRVNELDITDDVSENCESSLLQQEADFLYVGVWDLFIGDFNLADVKFPGEVFASFRGLAIETPGVVRSLNLSVPPSVPKPTIYRPRPKFNFTEEEFGQREANSIHMGDEPNRVVKAYWPFLRRVCWQSDHRGYVACGVNAGRAIYVSALGAPSEYDAGDEAAVDGEAPPAEADDHVRYTVLVKEVAHRQQLGRLLDRFNSLGTMRLFALKDLSVLRESSALIRLRGQELDAITGYWDKERERIAGAGSQSRNCDNVADLCARVEARLVSLNASLDDIGSTAVGGLSYRIGRSRYYFEAFRTRLDDMRIKRIEGWVPYDEFVRRRLYSQFDFISRIDDRMDALRRRVRSAMAAVQTSAIVFQTAATRENTEQVANNIKSTDQLAMIGVVLATVSLAAQSGLGGLESFDSFVGFYYCWLKTVIWDLPRDAWGLILQIIVSATSVTVIWLVVLILNRLWLRLTKLNSLGYLCDSLFAASLFLIFLACRSYVFAIDPFSAVGLALSNSFGADTSGPFEFMLYCVFVCLSTFAYTKTLGSWNILKRKLAIRKTF